jgi:hypothetical protein
MAVAVCAAAALSGCGLSPYAKKSAQIKVSGTVLFVPLRDKASYYYDSAEGLAIANAAMRFMRTKAGAVRLADYASARGPVRSAVMGAPDWTEIAKAARASYVVYGSIDEISWVDPDDPVMPRCLFTVSYHVFDAARGTDAYAATVSGRYPYLLVGDKGTSVFEMGSGGLEARAFAYIGEVIARTFYAHTISQSEDESLTSTRTDQRR